MSDKAITISVVSVILCVLVLLASCNSTRQSIKRIKSNTVGISRTITLFDANGKPIKSWETDSTYENAGTGINFLDKNEKFIAINGTFVVEEK
jgi:hypothetical protein